MWNSPPPTNTSKYIYMWNNSHWKLTGDWQKDSCTTKVVRKIHTKLSRKGREAISLGPVPLGVDSKEKGDYRGRDPPWGVSGGCPSLGVQQKEDKPPWLFGGLLGLKGELWKAWTALVKSRQRFAYSQSRAERVDWEHTLLTDFPHSSLCMHEPSKFSIPACLTL